MGSFDIIDQRGQWLKTLLPLEVRGKLIEYINNYVTEQALEDPADGKLVLPQLFSFDRMH